ncbi:MAG: hypothetical protein J7L55_03190 [Desulfurococcales archaeon]|nr:hypothetical protein [Desulfurococcales archaeon]
MSGEDVAKIKEAINSLDRGSKLVLKYFVQNRSVGELLALRELRGLYRIKDPARILARLTEMGLLERAPGCYNIPKKVLKALKEGA